MSDLISEENDVREIAIIIDTWDDIFSDFDPRPFSERMVSSDFIDELRRRHTETRSGNFLITLCAPAALKKSCGAGPWTRPTTAWRCRP